MEPNARKVVFTDQNRRKLGRATLSGGAQAGAIAGGVMLAAEIVMSAALGLGALMPVRMVAGAFYSVDALVGGADSVITGLVAHFMVAIALGVIFAGMIRPQTPVGTALAGGLIYGGVVWTVMTFIVLPIFDPLMGSRVAMVSTAWFAANLIFGATLAIAPALVRRSADRSGYWQSPADREERDRLRPAA